MGLGSSLIFLCHFVEGFVMGVNMLHIRNAAFVTGVDGFAVLETSLVKT